MERHKKLAIPVILLVLAATILGACVPAAPVEEPVPPAEEEIAPPVVEEEVEPITLRVWDTLDGAEENKAIEILNAEFEKAYDVKIERVVKSFDDMKATLPLAMTEPAGPDVAQVNQGRPDMGELVKAGLLVDLTPYAEKYGWDELFSPGILARTMFTGDGKEFGTGNLYGVAAMVQNVGVYYNREKFLNLGLTIPQTFDEFQAMLAEIKATGEVPIAFGNLDRWTAIHAYSVIQHVLVTRDHLDNFVYGRPNTRFDIPENIEAAAILQDWVKKGYFTDDFAGIGYDDSWTSFAGGEGVFLITGNWVTADLVDAIGGADRVGFFLVPPKEKGGKYLAIGGTDEGWSIRQGTKHPDLAAEYINWVVASPLAVDIWGDYGLLSVVPVDVATLPEGTVQRDIAAAYDILNRDDGIGHYIDWATPTMYDLIVAKLEELLAFKITPEDFVAAIQEDFTNFLLELEKG